MTKISKVPVIVCEFHQEVMQFIHRLIARKKLPFTNIRMIHFDSHPDLAFPDRLNADDCFSKEIMYNDLDIADWILPLIYEGHIDHVIWVKPPWADQIPDKKISFSVGKEIDTEKLRLTCTEDYFLEDCTFAPYHRLSNIKDVTLESRKLESLILKFNIGKNEVRNQTILPCDISSSPRKETDHENVEEREEDINSVLGNNCISPSYKSDFKSVEGAKHSNDSTLCRKHKVTLDSMDSNKAFKKKKIVDTNEPHGKDGASSEIAHLLADQKYILDLDLDFFSVTNPFLQDYTEEQYNELRKVYELEFPMCREDHDMLESSVADARKRLNEMKDIVESFGAGLPVTETDKNKRFLKLLKDIKDKNIDVDWEMVHNAGMTTELPHHISSVNEIDDLINQMTILLKELPRPTLITVARSTIDEYCPPDQIEMIQEKVLSALKSLYSEEGLEINFDYKDTSRLI